MLLIPELMVHTSKHFKIPNPAWQKYKNSVNRGDSILHELYLECKDEEIPLYQFFLKDFLRFSRTTSKNDPTPPRRSMQTGLKLTLGSRNPTPSEALGLELIFGFTLSKCSKLLPSLPKFFFSFDPILSFTLRLS